MTLRLDFTLTRKLNTILTPILIMFVKYQWLGFFKNSLYPILLNYLLPRFSGCSGLIAILVTLIATEVMTS